MCSTPGQAGRGVLGCPRGGQLGLPSFPTPPHPTPPKPTDCAEGEVLRCAQRGVPVRGVSTKSVDAGLLQTGQSLLLCIRCLPYQPSHVRIRGPALRVRSTYLCRDAQLADGVEQGGLRVFLRCEAAVCVGADPPVRPCTDARMRSVRTSLQAACTRTSLLHTSARINHLADVGQPHHAHLRSAAQGTEVGSEVSAGCCTCLRALWCMRALHACH